MWERVSACSGSWNRGWFKPVKWPLVFWKDIALPVKPALDILDDVGAGASLAWVLETPLDLVFLRFEEIPGLRDDNLFTDSERGEAHLFRNSSVKSNSVPWGGVGAP